LDQNEPLRCIWCYCKYLWQWS